MTTVYVSIGNSDDKLSQKEWAAYCVDVEAIVVTAAKAMHGKWTSPSRDPWQNACWCFEAWDHLIERSKQNLSVLAHCYRQDSIKWDVAAEPEFLQATPPR